MADQGKAPELSNQELQTLLPTGQAMSQEQDQERICQWIADASASLLGASLAAIALAPTRVHGPGALYGKVGDSPLPKPLARDLARLAEMEGPDRHRPGRLATFEPPEVPAGLTRRGIRHLARVQVHTIHHDFGALMVGKEEPWELGSREQFVLTTLANQAAVALENARLRREIEEGVERLQALIQASPLAIIARDRDANIQMWNPASERMFGWTEEEVLGGRYPLVPEDRRKEFHESLERSQRGEALTGIETRRLRKDGALIDAAIWTAPLHDGGAMVIIADITARKRVEEALVDMASFAEMNPAPVLRLDQHGTILLVNPAARQLFGEPDLLGKSWYALCLESEPIALERVLQSNDTLQCETQVGERCLLFTHRASLDRGQVYVYGADVTERKRAEEALRESEERARLIVESAQDAFICMDARGVITDWNPQAEATFGWPRSQAVGRLLAKTIIPPQHQEAHGRGLQHFLATGEGPVLNKRIELTALHRDGREFPVELTISAVQLGEAHIFHGFVHDISERKQAEEALRKSEEEFRSLFEDSRDAIYISAPDGKVLDVNQAALDLFGFTRDAAIGSDVGDRFVDPSDRERFRQEITTAGALRNFEVRLRKKNGSEMDCLLTATRRRAKNGGFAGGTQGIIHDITERKRAEEALRESETMLRQSEKMAQLGTLTAGVAHELNNPAAAVKSGAGQLEAAIAQFGQAQSQLSRLALTEAQQKTLQGLTQRAQQQAARPPEWDALARSDREGELETWLERRGIPNAWELAPALVNLNYDTAGLEALAESFGSDLPAVVGWLNATFMVYTLLGEIGLGAGRISENVKALKSYSYLDQAPGAVDIHEGLDNTLLILRHKLKSGISVRQEYAHHLPNIQANGSELNQVWTNILDNAADALEGQGEITIRTRQDGEWVVIEIEDDGPWGSGRDSIQDI